MTKDELISKQQLEIEALKKRLKLATQDKDEIISILVCVGGLLNDNFLQYSIEQRKPLHRILELAENKDHQEMDL